MKIYKIKSIIEEYKRQFQHVHDMEIYKWKAIKQFQDNWNPDSNNFREMMETALLYVENLLDAGNYYPKRMLSRYLEVEETKMKHLFLNLFNEEIDLFERIEGFRK